MPVTEALQTMGRWSLTLKEGTPKFIRDAVSTPWQHIVITPSWVDIAGMSDDDIVANALYTGVVLQPGPQYEIGGVGNLWWLGDERGVPHLTSPVTSGVGSSSLSTWVTSVLALTPIDVGTVTGAGPVGGNIRAAFTYQSARVALEAIFKYFQVEYRVNNDWTIDYGEAADLYGSDPVATALPRGQGGREFNLKGFRVTDLDYSRDFTDVLSHVTAAGRGGNGTATGIVPATDFSAYDREGGNIVRRAFFDVPEAALGFETNYAESIIARYSDVDFVGVSTDDFVRSQFSPGYLINVYDADRGLQDGDNQDFYQGEILFPKLVRVIGMQWPIQEGCGVYYRYHAATVVGAVTYTDLTPYVEWERPGTKIETGNPAYSPINEQFSVSAQTATVSAGTWDTYTPTITGAGTAVGSGTVVGFFRRIGTTLQIRITWTLAAGSTVGAGGVTFSMPTGITAVTQTNVFQMVEAMYNDTGTAVYHGHAYVGSGGTTLLCNVHAYNGAAAGVAYVTWAPLAAAVPHIWAATDFINLNGTIEVAP
jgi:hypothetical protein